MKRWHYATLASVALLVAMINLFSAHKSGGASLAPEPSGRTVPIGNLPGWRQVFYDDFRGESIPTGAFSGCSNGSPYVCNGLPAPMQSKWWSYADGWPDSEHACVYKPSQTVSISGDVLDIFFHTASDGTCMTAAPVPKLPGAVDSSNGQLYGRYSVRMKADPLTDYKAAFLLWPDSEKWPADGEIDFPEGTLDGQPSAYMHHQGATSASQQDGYLTGVTYTDWHTYTIEWTPNYVKFLLDDRVIGVSTETPLIPDTPMHWVLQAESGLDGKKPAASSRGNLQIAWVAIWSYYPSTT